MKNVHSWNIAYNQECWTEDSGLPASSDEESDNDLQGLGMPQVPQEEEEPAQMEEACE